MILFDLVEEEGSVTTTSTGSSDDANSMNPHFRVKYLLFATKKSFLRGPLYSRVLADLTSSRPELVVWWRFSVIASLALLSTLPVSRFDQLKQLWMADGNSLEDIHGGRPHSPSTSTAHTNFVKEHGTKAGVLLHY